ncbi:hypothetical protein [Mucilaginibacter flavus]|uniref:hypothetical protein n=1 Tax=Mucilaginibacter flavus TaxID=931504 RepID=UPI0025B5F88D|nr:hypothetical protein [Mucilaginibacter flavus]MDN3584030.1 hypothetical protein [Mucilaginibacter flavus]
MDRDAVLNQLRKSWLITLGLSPLAVFLGVQIVSSNKSQGFEGGQAVFLVSMLGVFLALILVLSATSIFLNLYPGIRQERTYSFFAWYLVPLLLCIIFITASDSADDLDMWMMVLPIVLPFFAIHTWFYIQFIKTMDKAKKEIENTTEQTQ